MDESKIRDIAFKIGQAVEFLHDHGIIVRDLSTHNILMTEKEIDENQKEETMSESV